MFSKVRAWRRDAAATSAATLLLAALVLAPFHSARPRPRGGARDAWLALLGLAIVSTTVAFHLLLPPHRRHRPVKASTVTLLVPVFGMIWGVAFLGEPLTPGRVTGCVIILFGCALILGLLRMPARRAAG